MLLRQGYFPTYSYIEKTLQQDFGKDKVLGPEGFLQVNPEKDNSELVTKLAWVRQAVTDIIQNEETRKKVLAIFEKRIKELSRMNRKLDLLDVTI